jgi:hypothetical protein
VKLGTLSPDGTFRPDAIPMVGKKYGHLTVLADAGRKDYGRKPYSRGWRLRLRQVRVRCDCGEEFVARASHVRLRIRRCLDCAKEENADRNRNEASVYLPNGKTIAQVAEESGVPLNTVYRRWLRGWPVEELGTPLRTVRPYKGLGGSVDLPERRRTVYPRT